MSTTIDHLPLPRFYLELVPAIIAGVIFFLDAVVAFVTDSAPVFGFPLVLGLAMFGLVGYSVYRRPHEDWLSSPIWLALGYLYAIMVAGLFALSLLGISL